MRFLLAMILILGMGTCNAQLSGFPHEYRIRPDYSTEQPIIRATQMPDEMQGNFRLTIFGRDDQPYPFARISLEGGNKRFEQTTDPEGAVNLNLEPGSYDLRIGNMVGYLPLNHSFILEPNHTMELSVVPARGNRVEVFVVYSRESLTDADLEQIEECLKANGTGCSQEGEYVIFMEI